MEQNYYQKQYEDSEKRERNSLEKIENLKITNGWLIAFLILAFITIIILGCNAGNTIITNSGISFENATQMAIKICQALN